jgi:hypothetical protein
LFFLPAAAAARRQQTPVHCAFSMMLPRIFFGQVQILMDEPDAVEFSSNLLILLS